jgi:hypothetical protein
MRLGLWLLVPLGFSGCSGGYPLEPTPCDDLCHAIQGSGCPEDYQPAACVLSCESGDVDAPPCRQLFDAVIGCYRATPSAVQQRCDYWVPDEQRACSAEQTALAFCVGALSAPERYGP